MAEHGYEHEHECERGELESIRALIEHVVTVMMAG